MAIFITLLPSEIECLWLIPAIRSIIAQQLVGNYDFSQADAAKLLGVTQAAISYYLRGSRGKNDIVKKLEQDKQIMLIINDIVKSLKNNGRFSPHCMAKYIELLNYVRHTLFICEIHRSVEKTIDSKLCNACEKFILKVV